jgi:N-acetylmuramoyl-L-alanine amidase
MRTLLVAAAAAALIAAAPAAESRTLPLAGKTIAVDPGHNGANWSHPEEINRLVDAGGFRKACDTTGASTDDGYTRRRTTSTSHSGWRASCAARRDRRPDAYVERRRRPVHRRARGDRQSCPRRCRDLDPRRRRTVRRARFHVIYKPNAPDSRRLAAAVRRAFAAGTGEPYSTYADATAWTSARTSAASTARASRRC